MITRRTALKTIVGGAFTVYLSGCSGLFKRNLASSQKNEDFFPIDRSIDEENPDFFSGDDPSSAHAALWDKLSFINSKGGFPKPSEYVPLTIIGGGMSGLASAYLLQKYNPIILEQAPRFGGNAKGESWKGIDYSIGAAYISEPTAGTPIDKFLTELGAKKIARLKVTEDPVEIHGEMVKDFWHQRSEVNAHQLKVLLTFFKALYNEEDGLLYPELPSNKKNVRKLLKKLDQQTFKEFLEKKVGGRLDPQIEALIEEYCWSSFDASASEISAAAGLNFYTADFGNTLVMPGGNSAVAELILKKLEKKIPLNYLRPKSLVLDVKAVKDGVIITYLNEKQQLQAIHSKIAVMSCPKFVVNKVLADIEPPRAKAISKIKYRSYLVANVLLEGPPRDDFYDMYLLENGKPVQAADSNRATDVILANFAAGKKDNTVLTLYKGMPFDEGRSKLFSNDAHFQYREEFEMQVREKILPLLGFSISQMKGMRLTRWGHPIPVPHKGFLTEGTVDTLRKPFQGRVFFVEQDNWLTPSFESAVNEALYWAPKISTAIRT